MFHFKPLDIIQHNNDIGIIAEFKGNKVHIYFETADGVEGVWYPVTAIYKYRVIG